jgi:hypothetical protein
MPCSAISSGMRSRYFATIVAAASSGRPRCIASTGAIEGVVGMFVPPENTVDSTVRASAAATSSPTSSQRTDRCGRCSRCGSRRAPVELRAAAPNLSSSFAAVGTGGVFSGRCSSSVSISVGTSNHLSPEPQQASRFRGARKSVSALIDAAVKCVGDEATPRSPNAGPSPTWTGAARTTAPVVNRWACTSSISTRIRFSTRVAVVAQRCRRPSYDRSVISGSASGPG